MPIVSERPTTHQTSLSGRLASPIGARILLGAFFSVFLAVGVGAGGAFFGKPILRMIDAQSWPATPCEVLSSKLVESRSSDGSTYRVAVTYRYDVGGRAYTGDRYKFVPGSSSGSAGKRAIVAQLPPGTRTDCYVNPADPNDAVIERGPTADLWFGIIPLVFGLVGAGGVGAAIFGRGPMTKGLLPRNLPPTHVTYSTAPDRGRVTRLLPVHSRGAKLVGFALFTLFWNGIVSVFLFQVFGGWRSGVFGWVLAVFLIPFVLAGIALAVFVIHMALGYVNPLPLITVSSPVVPLGDELKVSWAIDGRAEKLRRFSIQLEGRELATYRRGTSSVTDTQVFATFALADQIGPVALSGAAKVTIPERSMHSFQAANNKIVWVIRVRGDIANWPDSDDEFPLTVTPRTR